MQPVKDSIDFKLMRDRYWDAYQVLGIRECLQHHLNCVVQAAKGSVTIDALIDFLQEGKWRPAILQLSE